MQWIIGLIGHSASLQSFDAGIRGSCLVEEVAIHFISCHDINVREPENAKKTERQLLTTLADFRFALRQFLHFSEQAALNAGLQPQQYQLLLQAAGAASDAAVTVTYVAERLGLKHNSAVELLDRSEHEGLVAREEDAGDRRRILVRITRKGERLLDRLAGDHARELTVLAPQLIQNLERVRRHAADGPR